MEIEAHSQNLRLFKKKKLTAEEIERLENEAETVQSEYIKQWCQRKIKELQ